MEERRDESDSMKKDLFKRDIFEAITEELLKKRQQVSFQNRTPDKKDLGQVLAKLKQSVEELEGDLNGEANDILKELSVVLSEKVDEDEAPPMLVRQETFIISTNERLFGGKLSDERLEEDDSDQPRHHGGHTLHERLSEALKRSDIKNKVIVVLVVPDCVHGLDQLPKKQGSTMTRPQTCLTSSSNVSPLTRQKPSPKPNRCFSTNSLNNIPRQLPQKSPLIRKGSSVNQSIPKQLQPSPRPKVTPDRRRTLSPHASIRSLPMHSPKSTSKIPTPQKAGSTRNVNGLLSEKSPKGKQGNRPVTRFSLPNPASIYGSPYGKTGQKKKLQ